MKIAIEASVLTYPNTGVAKSLLNLMQHIEYDVEFVLFTQESRPLQCLPNFPFKLIRYSDYGGGELESCDFIHYHWNGGILPQFKQNILMIHDVLPLILNRNPFRKYKYHKYINTQIKLAKIILTPSEYSKSQIMRYFKPKKPIFVIPHGVDNISKPTQKRENYYIYVGGYDPRKGLVYLLRTFLESKIKRKLIFVGEIKYFSKEFENLAKIAESKQVLKQVGYVSDEDLRGLLSNAKALIYPSKFEGFGLPTLEAMALGTPVLTTAFSSIKEVCGEAAMYFNPDIKKSLEMALYEFESNPKISQNLIKYGYKNIARFSWKNSAKKYMEILRNNIT
ncbi:hypothetical protein CCY99_00550 [Helicobacter sp. 16-1353]|uniref:glycosyltransferase family 4 protein n=1 Tax=Helicobacter sp. 16-1353 TaxID=2004996 RepID=UPI000DCD6B5E|nr:glycosyltransferase family 1 protein [Helicobacter sp. 16-1353]RAX55222.1 hypothetical protein CCY99_00550 [Helicobacter sp. 16-1353]